MTNPPFAGKTLSVYWALVVHRGHTITRAQLRREAGLKPGTPVDPYVRRVREYLAAVESDDEVLTVQGRGYVFKRKGAPYAL